MIMSRDRDLSIQNFILDYYWEIVEIIENIYVEKIKTYIFIDGRP